MDELDARYIIKTVVDNEYKGKDNSKLINDIMEDYFEMPSDEFINWAERKIWRIGGLDMCKPR